MQLRRRMSWSEWLRAIGRRGEGKVGCLVLSCGASGNEETGIFMWTSCYVIKSNFSKVLEHYQTMFMVVQNGASTLPTISGYPAPAQLFLSRVQSVIRIQ